MSRETREQARKREARADRTTLALGAATSFALAVAAVGATLTPGRDPAVMAMEHFSVFARPAALLERRLARETPVAPAPPGFAAPAAPSPREAQSASASRPVSPDMTPLAALPEVARVVEPRAPARTLAGWRTQDVVGGRVLVVGPQGVRWAAPGVDLGEAGVVRNVEIDRDGPAVVTDKGRIGR